MKPNAKKQPPRPPSSRGYIVLAFIFTVAAVSAWLAINRDNIREFSDTYKSREKAREKIVDTQNLITRLKRQQQSLNYNGLESQKQMRERLQLHLPGEQVVFFETESPTKGSATQTKVTTSTQSSELMQR